MNPAYRLSFGLIIGLAVVVAFGFAQPALPRLDDAFFTKNVAPVLSKNCLSCHNPDKARGGLDFSTRATTLTGGDKGPVIVPGDSAKSLLVKMIRGPMPKMPRMAAPLSDAEVDLLARWIDGGAPWPKGFALSEKAGKTKDGPWWSLQPIVKPAIPANKNPAWAKNVIDRFILASLQAKGLTPSKEAERSALIRRVTFDLHGLPPTLAEIEAFVNDQRPDAYERLIDRLLASPRYGERWARLWLDLVHYADTHGYDKDKKRLWAWLYRDWVIRAFNSDMPYRRFIRQQIAGDALFSGDADGIIATGFVVAGPWDFVGQVELREGTVDKEKTRVLDRDDMLANTLSTFCSVTIHCARCHDHKFDPIPTKEYYQLQSVFAGVERGDRPVASKDVQPLRDELERKRNDTQANLDRLAKKIAGLASPELTRLDERIAELQKTIARLPIFMPNTTSPTNGYHSAIEKTPDAPKWVQVDLGRAISIAHVRLLPARPTDFPDTPGFGFPARFKIAVTDDVTFAKAQVVADHAGADLANPGDQPMTIPVGVKARYVRVAAKKLWKRSNDYVFALAELQVYDEAGKNVALGAKVTALDTIEAGRWSTRHLVDGFTSRQRLLADAPAVRDRLAAEADVYRARAERQRTFHMLIDADTRNELAHLGKQLEIVQALLAALKDSMKAFAVVPIAPRPIHVLARGDVERKGALALPGGLGLLKGLERPFHRKWESAKESERRVALADWIAADANVLTWRSIVNRVWQYHFGKGFVDTPSDFGRNGSRPTHPELLDYLAAEFRDADSFKKLHRMILLSATYRQASTHDPANAKIDADNRYLWRMNRQRLDAESIRDSVLAISGKIDYKMYGPGYELFRFKDDHSPIYDHLDASFINRAESWRRTVYRFVVRSVPNPFLETLDCADPNISVPMRNTTMTALQALALLNNPFMVKQAEFFAERVAKMEKDAPRQVDAAYRLAFGRSATPAERTAMSAYVGRHGLANACRLLFNANEFLFVD